MRVVEYSAEYKARWDEFIENSNNGTIFHTQKFFDYHTPGKFQFQHLMILEGDAIVAALPGRVVEGYFESPIGASYGSLVTPSVKFHRALELVDVLLEHGKNSGYKGYLLTSAPMIYEKEMNQNLDFAMLWRGFSYDLHYISSAIHLDPHTDFLMRINPSTRKNIRKTLRNPDLTVEINDRYDEFYPILIENKARHNVKPTHSLPDIYKLAELFPEAIKLFMLYHKGKPIAGSLVFVCNSMVTLCFYNMLLYDYAEFKPIERINYEVVKWSTENGYHYVDIGVSQDTKADNPMTPSISLIEFKERFDAKTIMRNTLKFTY